MFFPSELVFEVEVLAARGTGSTKEVSVPVTSTYSPIWAFQNRFYVNVDTRNEVAGNAGAVFFVTGTDSTRKLRYETALTAFCLEDSRVLKGVPVYNEGKWSRQLDSSVQAYKVNLSSLPALDRVEVDVIDLDTPNWAEQLRIRVNTPYLTPLETSATKAVDLPVYDLSTDNSLTPTLDPEFTCVENAQNNNQTIVVMTQRWG